MARSQPDVVYAGGVINTSGAVARSTDRGASWTQVSAPTDTVCGLAVDPDDANLVFAATTGGAWRTTDGGANWSRVCTQPGLRSVAAYPGGPDTLVVGGDNGAWVSHDGGANWQAMSDGLEGHPVTCLVFTGMDAVRLYAGTGDAAAWCWSFTTGVAEGPGLGATAGRASIVRGELVLPGAALGQCPSVLLDISGRVVLELRQGANDVRHLAPGCYFVRVGGEPARKVLLQR